MTVSWLAISIAEYAAAGAGGHLAGQISGGQNGLFQGPNQLTILFLVGIFGGLYAFWKGFGVYGDYRVEADIPLVPVRGAAMGLVHVSGKAGGGGTILSPVSQMPCLFYRVRLERQAERSAIGQYNRAFTVFGLMDSIGIGSSVNWVTERVVDNGSVFELDDGTGKIAVDLHGAKFLVEQSGQCEMDPVSAYAAAGGSTDLVTPEAYGAEGPDGSQCRLTEYAILPGMKYDLVGLCAENPEAGEGGERNLVRKGGEKFMISDETSRNTQLDLHHRAMAKVFGGGLVAVACLAALLSQFGLL